MALRRVRLENFMGTSLRELELGQAQILVGKNGRGKSTIREAITWALHGRTSTKRPHRPYDGSSPTVVTVQGDNLTVTRTHGKGSPSLSLDPDPQMETTPKAQAWLDTLTGGFDAWSRACVFTGDDVNNSILRLTDKGRKQALEEMLPDDGLEAAGKRLTILVSASNSAVVRLERDIAVLEERVRQLQPRVAAEEAPDPERVAAAQQELAEAQRLLDEAKRASWAADSAATSAAAAVSRFTADGSCVTCGQEIPDETRKRLLQAKKDADEAKQEAIWLLAAEQVASDAAASEWRTIARQLEASRVDPAQAMRLQAAEVELEEKRVELKQAERKRRALLLLQNIMGWKGVVRANRLRDAVAGLNGLIAVHMRSLDPERDILLRLTVTALEAVVRHAETEMPISVLSTGEVKRAAIATALATSALSSRGGLLIIDEAFDGLDEDGAAAVVALLEAIAEERQVIMISHDSRIFGSMARIEI